MIVEVIAVGTELLLGQIVNSNAAFIGRALADSGLDAHVQVTVGDNIDRVASTIRQALERADAMIIPEGSAPPRTTSPGRRSAPPLVARCGSPRTTPPSCGAALHHRGG